MEHSLTMYTKLLIFIISFNPDTNSEKLLYRWGNSLGTIAEGHSKPWNKGSDLGLADWLPAWV